MAQTNDSLGAGASHPKEPDTLPPPLMTSTPGSFARKTIVERKPQILSEVSRAHAYPPEVQAALAVFGDEIRSAPIRPLTEHAPDAALWNGEWRQYEGRTWLEVPWYFAEAFFYRRLMEAVHFYQPGAWYNIDPFAPQKEAELLRALPAFLSILGADLVDECKAFNSTIGDALWGNRADLSNRTLSATADEGLQDRQADRLLIDDRARIWQTLSDGPLARVDVVTDNSGLELLLDLRLVDHLLQGALAREVRIHLKRMPFFVSDARVRDLFYTLDRLEMYDAGESGEGKALATRLRQALDEARLTLRDDPFWSSPLSYRPLPEPIRRELTASDLVLFKGDVNYRRLLDDRQWPHVAHLADIAADFPAPFVALRTLKGELIVDLKPGQADALSAEDPTWMINGQRGLIQFVEVQRGRG